MTGRWSPEHVTLAIGAGNLESEIAPAAGHPDEAKGQGHAGNVLHEPVADIGSVDAHGDAGTLGSRSIEIAHGLQATAGYGRLACSTPATEAGRRLPVFVSGGIWKD
jgi:hypothetical protein